MHGRFRRRWRGRGRPPKPRVISFTVGNVVFVPMKTLPQTPADAVVIAPDELEALRLVYLENYSQSEAANKMGISRGTLWRLLNEGRRKIVKALVEVKPIVISPSYP